MYIDQTLWLRECNPDETSGPVTRLHAVFQGAGV